MITVEGTDGFGFEAVSSYMLDGDTAKIKKEAVNMKKVLSLILAIILAIGTISLTGCRGTDESGVEMVSSYMLDDDTVVVKFRNETNKTISHVNGRLNLFGGSSNSQSPLKTASFEWDGTCEKGKTFEVTVSVYNAPAGLADDVNRIGFHISSIS